MGLEPVAVPLCDTKGSYERHREAIDAAVRRVLESGQVILGPEVTAFEREFAEFCGVKHAVGCSSGSDALLLALAALGIGPGDEVILPPFTFFATAGAVCRAGATPVFVDIDSTNYHLDPNQVEDRITAKTKAILPVHLYGLCAPMSTYQDIANRHRVHLIEDAAQACGASWQGKKAGSMGSVGCFSFYPTKAVGAFGDAGIVTTNDATWAARLASLRVHGMEQRYHHTLMGWNARLDAIHAAMLRVKLPYVEQDIAARRAAAKLYAELIVKNDLQELLLPPTTNDVHTFNPYVVQVTHGRRDELMAHLKSRQIGCEVYYPVSLHLQECLRHLGYRKGDFPVSELMSQRVLALPMFAEITPEQQAHVISCCAEFALTRKPNRTAA